MQNDKKCNECKVFDHDEHTPCKYLKFITGFLAILISAGMFYIGTLTNKCDDLNKKVIEQSIDYSAFKSSTNVLLNEQKSMILEIKSDTKEIKNNLYILKAQK